MPLLSASTINSIRRLVADDLDRMPVWAVQMANTEPSSRTGRAGEGISPGAGAPAAPAQPLMLSKYCIKYELGL